MKRVVILGGGESGTGAAILAKKQGFEVFLSDYSVINERQKEQLNRHNIEWEEQQHSMELIFNADEVIKSPGIPDTAAVVLALREKGVPIISEIEMAGRYSSAKMIGITGSNGKTTTAKLLYHILSGAGLDVGLAGNVGDSLAKQVAEKDRDYFVVELSSFQLDDMHEFKADIAILLNITPDHLDRYDNDFQKYIDSKFRIVQNQSEEDLFIFWAEDPVIQREMQKRVISSKLYPFAEGKTEKTRAFVEKEEIIINVLNEIINMPTSNLALKGRHNRYNSMAAGLTASLVHVKKERIRQSLSDFQGVEHRLEYVATVRDVRYINDSKATNVNSCWYALQSIDTSVVLIIGGTDKGNDYSLIEDLVKEKVSTLIFMGADNSKLHAFFDGKVENIIDTNSMHDSVQAAYKHAKAGETVLLSPACASFDLFENYEERGVLFKREVRSL